MIRSFACVINVFKKRTNLKVFFRFFLQLFGSLRTINDRLLFRSNPKNNLVFHHMALFLHPKYEAAINNFFPAAGVPFLSQIQAAIIVTFFQHRALLLTDGIHLATISI